MGELLRETRQTRSPCSRNRLVYSTGKDGSKEGLARSRNHATVGQTTEWCGVVIGMTCSVDAWPAQGQRVLQAPVHDETLEEGRIDPGRWRDVWRALSRECPTNEWARVHGIGGQI